LWTRLMSDLGVDAVGVDRDGAGIGLDVAQLFQKALVGRGIGDGARVVPMPLVNLMLQSIAFGQQALVFVVVLRQKVTEAAPKILRADRQSGQYVVIDEVRQFRGHFELMAIDQCAHETILSWAKWSTSV
jgi:hypothetical protein